MESFINTFDHIFFFTADGFAIIGGSVSSAVAHIISFAHVFSSVLVLTLSAVNMWSPCVNLQHVVLV